MAAQPHFAKAKHVKYWQRCHSTHLPAPYTANDSTRLTLAFFIIAALDLLSVPLSKNDRAALKSWVLSLQHPEGGFCGSPLHAMPGGTANLAATFFALLLLGMAAGEEEDDDEGQQGAAFEGVERGRLLTWLRRLQREDGSFGQVLWEGLPVGGRDTRHSYLAAGVRWMLRGEVKEGDEMWEEDIDVDKMVEHIEGVQTYDGGISESAQQESHAGYAYCAVAALTLLDRAPSATQSEPAALTRGISDRPALLKWLLHRQFAYQPGEEEQQKDSEGNYVEAKLGELRLDDGDDGDEGDGDGFQVGVNGRWNKKADTCYCWWVGGTLHLLDSPDLFDAQRSRAYLLNTTQHIVGGFSKAVGAPPDLYHSYLGLAALSMMGEDGDGEADLKALDLSLCCSRDAVRKVERAREGLLEAGRRVGREGWATDAFWAEAGR